MREAEATGPRLDVRDGALPMDRPVGAGGDRSDRNGPGYVGSDLGLVNPGASGWPRRTRWRQGPGDSDPFSRREARRDHAAGRQVRSTFAGIVCSLRRPACAPRDRPLTLRHFLVAQGSCAQIDKMAAGPTYSAGGRRAPAGALLVDPSTRPAWRPSARVRDVTGFSAPTGIGAGEQHQPARRAARIRYASRKATAEDHAGPPWAVTARSVGQAQTRWSEATSEFSAPTRCGRTLTGDLIGGLPV